MAVTHGTNHVSIRDVEKIVSTIALASINKDLEKDNVKNLEARVSAMCDLVIAKIIKPALYEKLKDGSATDEDLIAHFGVTSERIARHGNYQKGPEHIDGNRPIVTAAVGS